MWGVIVNAQSMEPSLIANASVTLGGVEHIAKILDVQVMEKIVLVMGNVTALSILVYVRMDGLVTDAIFQTALEIQTVQIEVRILNYGKHFKAIYTYFLIILMRNEMRCALLHSAKL